MMIWLWIYLAAIGASGLALAIALGAPGQRRRLVELMGLSAILGSGAVPIALLWISMLGIKPQRISILGIGLVAILAIFFLWKLKRFPILIRPFIPRMSGIDLAILGLAGVLIGIQFVCVIAIALDMPTLDVDGFAIWGLKAKVLFNQPLNPRPDYFSDLSLSYSHLDYPLLAPMLWAGGMTALNDADNVASKGALLVPLAGMILLLYAALRDALPRSRAALLTAIVAGAPAVVRWSGQGLADTTLAAFFLAAAVALMRWIRDGKMLDAVLAALCATMAMQTKLEGMMILVSTLVVLTVVALFRKSIPNRGRAWFVAVITAVIIALPWLIWSSDLPHTHENYGARFTPDQIANGMSRLPAIARFFGLQAYSWSWTVLAAMLLLAAAIGWRGFRHAAVLAGWTMLVIQLAAYLCAYLVAPWDLGALITTTASRLLLHVAPLAALLAGLHWQAARSDQASF